MTGTQQDHGIPDSLPDSSISPQPQHTDDFNFAVLAGVTPAPFLAAPFGGQRQLSNRDCTHDQLDSAVSPLIQDAIASQPTEFAGVSTNVHAAAALLGPGPIARMSLRTSALENLNRDSSSEIPSRSASLHSCSSASLAQLPLPSFSQVDGIPTLPTVQESLAYATPTSPPFAAIQASIKGTTGTSHNSIAAQNSSLQPQQQQGVQESTWDLAKALPLPFAATTSWAYSQQPSYEGSSALQHQAAVDDGQHPPSKAYYSPPQQIKPNSQAANTSLDTNTHNSSPSTPGLLIRQDHRANEPSRLRRESNAGSSPPAAQPVLAETLVRNPNLPIYQTTPLQQSQQYPRLQTPQHAQYAQTSSGWHQKRAQQQTRVCDRHAGPRPSTPTRRRCGAWHELWQLLKLALPCIIITGSTQVVIVASQVLSGHLGTQALAAASLGNVLWLVGYYAIIGTATALETLGAQAVGSGDTGRLIMWDLAAAICATLLALPLAGALWNAGVLAAALLAQDTTLCDMVELYCKGLVPGLLPQVWAIILSKHMQAQSQVLLPALVAGSAAAAYIGLAPQVVTQHGLLGVSLAASAARAYQCVAMLLAVLSYEAYKGTRWCSQGTWLRGLARWQLARRGRTLQGFLSLGAPGCLGSAIESSGWEVTTAMAAYLGTLQVAVHSSALSLATLVIMGVPMAIAVAASIRVASLLGSGQGKQAQICSRLAVGIGTCMTCLLGGVIIWQRDRLGWIFTATDMEVVNLLSSIAPLVAVYQGLAGLLGSTQGVLRGIGRQGALAVHQSLGLGAGTLLGAWLTWGPQARGLAGLWAGSILGTGITALLNGIALMLVDWNEEVHVARTMQAMQQGVRFRQRMLMRALRAGDIADETLVEALLAEAQQDPRPLHIIYQEYAWVQGNSVANGEPTHPAATSPDSERGISAV